MIIEKKNIKAIAKFAFKVSIVSLVIFLFVSVIGIIVVDENIHIVRTLLIISSLFFILIFYIIIKHYCIQSIHKVMVNNEKIIFYSLFKSYTLQLVEHITITDSYGRIIIRIGKEKLIFYKFMFGETGFTKNEIEHLIDK